MTWFITAIDPGLRVPVPGADSVIFHAAEYYTQDPAEVAALRACPDVVEVNTERVVELAGYVINLNNQEIHDLSRADSRCNLPDAVRHASSREDFNILPGWKHYLRLSDAQRWNPSADGCAHCLPAENLK